MATNRGELMVKANKTIVMMCPKIIYYSLLVIIFIHSMPIAEDGVTRERCNYGPSPVG